MNTSAGPSGVVVVGRGGPPRWAHADQVCTLADAELGPRLVGAHAALIDGEDPAATEIARRVRAADPDIQIVLVSPAELAAELQRRILLTPGVGEVWIAGAAELDGDLLSRAAEVTRQRRGYHRTRRQLGRAPDLRLDGRGGVGTITEAYLAALLQVFPHAVVSIDENGRVISWNPAAERIFGRPASEAVGSSVFESVAGGGQLQELLDRGRAAVAIGDVELEDGDRRILDVTVVPVRTGGLDVRAVVLQDVTESRAARRMLEEQAAELEVQAETLRDQREAVEQLLANRTRFYASMSHELRTPVNAILGYNDLLLAGVFGPLAEEQLTAVGNAQKAAKHLLELINDVLDLSKIEAGKIEVEWQEVRLPELLDDLATTARPLASEHGSELILDSASCMEPVITDARRVRQILLNLISNAAKFGRARPIRISCQRTERSAILTVEDEGIGILPEDLGRIFEEFVQLPGGNAGTGLGLAISLRLARLLGGSLHASSTPGVGSRFTLALPIPPPRAD